MYEWWLLHYIKITVKRNWIGESKALLALCCVDIPPNMPLLQGSFSIILLQKLLYIFLQSFCAKRKQILTTTAASKLTIQITGCSKWIVINPFAVFSHSFSVRADLRKCKAAINGPKTHARLYFPTQFFIQAHESKIVLRVGKSEFNLVY